MMSAADEVAIHIHGSLLDLRRRLDARTAIEVARAVVRGAEQALRTLSDEDGPDLVDAGPVERSSDKLGLFDLAGLKQ
jgi:cob(I)alamin adenosyltransferase